MDEKDLNKYLDLYGRHTDPDLSRDLVDRLMRVPHEVEQAPVSLFRAIRDLEFWQYLVPRMAGLALACAAGIYFGTPSDNSIDLVAYDLAVNDYLLLSNEFLEQEDNS
ncbi:hypothetical protein [Emcibacter nanhaiensis]|uniref:Uncharacterized protein n=2 Tax=Emcibacter nanhaiensis TaxID=1505037 RepID=A0A501PI13_9PROT|nr:hypothetical protein [Emcibacter nanhaiensis]TPD59747.1 hypothetical protein FIV46_09655 [Emcibacter nanhaiensis]